MFYFINNRCDFIHELNTEMFEGGIIINERVGYYFKRIIICGNIVCVKVIQKYVIALNFDRITTMISNIHSLYILSQMNDPNILQLYAIYEDSDHIYIVFETPLYGLSERTPSSESDIVNNIIVPLLDTIKNTQYNQFFIKSLKLSDLYYSTDKKWKIGLYNDRLFYDKTIQVYNVPSILYDIGAIVFELLSKHAPYSHEARIFIADCTRHNLEYIMNHEWIHTNKHYIPIRHSCSLPEFPVSSSFSLSRQNSTITGTSPPNIQTKMTGFKMLKQIFKKKLLNSI